MSVYHSSRCKGKSQETGIESSFLVVCSLLCLGVGAKENPKKRELKVKRGLDVDKAA